jgi:hypothetical protein
VIIEPEKPRPKPSVEDVRSRRVRRQRVADDDQLALKFDRIKTAQNIRERLKKLNLDPDECERLAEELMESLNGDERKTM